MSYILKIKKLIGKDCKAFIFDRYCLYHQHLELREISSYYPNEHIFYYRDLSKIIAFLNEIWLFTQYETFNIPEDLPRQQNSSLASYTVKLEDGSKMIMRGDINQPLMFLSIGQKNKIRTA